MEIHCLFGRQVNFHLLNQALELRTQSYYYFLSRDRRVGNLGGAWCVKRNDHNQYLQIDLRKPTRITKVITQGRYDANQFVRNYYLYYSQNGRTFLPIKEGGKVKVRNRRKNYSSFVEMYSRETFPRAI